MAPPKEHSARAPILPRPELNPLLNPLLGENMGRWAEVYFTSAPEKREEAVLELIRELEAGDSPPEVREKSEPPTLSKGSLPDPEFPRPEFPVADFAVGDQPGLAHCYVCGHDSPAQHQFCGMCGEKFFADEVEGFAGSAKQAEPGPGNTIFDAPPYARSQGGQAVVQRVELDQTPIRQYDQLLAEPDELSHLRRISGCNPEGVADFRFSLEPSSSRPYRIYFGVALVAGLLGAVYFLGHGGQASKTAQPQVSPAPPIGATEPEPVTPAAANPPTEPAAAPPVVPPASHSTHAQRREEQAARQLSAKRTPSGAAPGSLGYGRKELEIARRYLSRGSGGHRNRAEAAEWLWKSIAKHNSEATLLLADLYLKGNGVPKNCDQARVLLDSAARKGVAGAGERLRNLQAFGCR